jgi:hypothetical protein
MQWLSSGIGEIWPREAQFKDASMSAIAAVYSSRFGFVIGADGRARWSIQENLGEDRKGMESEQEQKIFEAATTHGTIVYGVTGTAYNDDKSFSVIAESQKAASALSGLTITNYLEYVDRFSEIIRASIAAAHAEDRFDYNPSTLCPPGQENMIVRLFSCGYFQGKPFACDVQIVHENETLSCQPVPYDIEQMKPVVLGSKRIAELMYLERDWRFRNYTTAITPDSTIHDAIECVRGYLRACSTPLARRLDPFCEIIGGHIHIATVSPQSRFQWSTRPVTAE